MEWLRRQLTRRAAAGEAQTVAEAGQGAQRPTALRRCWQAVQACFCVGRWCRRCGTLEDWETDELVEYIRWLTSQQSHVSVASRPAFYTGSEESSPCGREKEAAAGSCLNGEELRDGARPRIIFYIGSGTSSLASQEGNAGAAACLKNEEAQEGARPRPIFYISSGTSSLASEECHVGAGGFLSSQEPQEAVRPRPIFYIGSGSSSLDSCADSMEPAEDCAALQLPHDTVTRCATFYIGSDTSSLESF